VGALATVHMRKVHEVCVTWFVSHIEWSSSESIMVVTSRASIGPTTQTCMSREVTQSTVMDEEAKGGTDKKEEHRLRDGGGKEHFEVRVGCEFFKEGKRCANNAPLDRGQDGGGSRVGDRLNFNGKLVEQHGKAVLHHGTKSQEADALAAGSR
jgi:hypothetical protein